MSKSTKSPKKNHKQSVAWRFFISKTFWLSIFASIVAMVGLLWAVLFFIQQYSRHGESQTVPNLLGKTTVEAMDELHNLDLDYAVMDSTFDPEERPLSVISQDPLPGSKVKNGRKIYVTVNMKFPPQTEVPHIELGTSYISVREILSSRGLMVGDIIYKPFEYKDVYLDMHLHGDDKMLKPGSKVAKGSKIDLVLGNGLGDTKVIIPNLSGLTYIEAVNLISLKELSLGTIIAIGTITDTAEAFVFRQYPGSEDGKTVNLGSMVDIWITESMDDIPQDDEP